MHHVLSFISGFWKHGGALSAPFSYLKHNVLVMDLQVFSLAQVVHEDSLGCPWDTVASF